MVPCDEDWQVVSSLPDKESNDTAPISPVRGSDETGSSSLSIAVTPSPVQDNEVSSSPEQNLLENSPSIDNVVTHVDLVDLVSKPSTSESESVKVVPVIKPRQSQRPHNAPVWLKVYVTNNVICTPDPLHALSDPTSQSSNSVPCKSQYPLSDYISDEYFSSGHRAFLAAVTSNVEPKHFKEAVKIDVWNKAMATEVDALEINKTWDLCDLPPNKTALGSQWVYKTKFNSDGSVERYKARLVSLGNNQVEGEDYTETFAPLVKMTTVRTLLRLVAANQWEMYQMDVHNAFLHSDLDEEVYMKLPLGFRHSHPDKVCRLRKSLYGLKQAPRCWFKKLSDSLLKFGFVQSYDDYSLFSYTHKDIELRVLIYVDDLLICGNDGYMLKKFKEYLGKCFSMKDLGKPKYFLGIEISRGPEGIFLSQRKYALDIIADCGVLGSRPSPTPLEQNHRLARDDGPLLADPKPYRRLVGRLLYLLHTRPELSYYVHVLSQFMQAPREAHWAAALRIVKFLKGLPGQGILLKADKDLSLTVYCDYDHSSCPLTRRSLSAYIVFLGDSPISWKTKKQETVSFSSVKAEYRAMAAALKEIKWMLKLLKGLGIEHRQPVRLFCDNKTALHIAANPVFHERTKHVENDCHAVRDAVQDGTISTHHVRTEEQLADIFTKTLGRNQFEFLMSKLGVQNLHPPT